MLSADQMKKMTPDLSDNDMQHIRDWVTKQPHLPHVSDEMIIMFLHSCHHRLEPCKVTIDSYYSLRTQIPEVLRNRDPLLPEVEDIFSAYQFPYLPQPDSDGNALLIGRMVDTDPARFSHASLLKAVFMVEDIELAERGPVQGWGIVFDFQGFSLGHAARMNLALSRRHCAYIQDGFPGILGSIHVINMSPAADKIFNFLKSLVSKDIVEKIHVHTSLESFYKFVPKERLPKEYGGDLESMEVYHNQTWEKVKRYRDWLMQEEAFRVNESKRQGRTTNGAYGIEGSFKKLDID